MNDLEYRQQVLDRISGSFCGAKWFNATIWLGSGQTTSCHHPPAHAIDVSELQHNPSAIHNTQQKKQDRALMQQGQRPRGCEYCWKIEDMGKDAVSDRVYKSRIYQQADLIDAANSDSNRDVNLKTLEISFDRTCQFACSYCNPAFSTSWVRDIRQNGAYDGLVTDGRNHYTHDHSGSQLFKIDEPNPYADAFFRWWETDLHQTLDELRITGGEPLMSGHTWKLIQWFKNNRGRSRTRLAINTNLGFDMLRLAQLVHELRDIPHVEIYTSNESTGQQAEYIRDGLDWQQWTQNVNTLLLHDHIRAVHSMCTISALGIWSLCDYLEHLVALKKQYGRERVNFTLNILRFPSFQSALILPDDLKQLARSKLLAFMQRHQGAEYLHEHEVRHLERLVEYLDTVKTPHSEAFDVDRLQQDFKRFFQQYDQRRSKNFVLTFPELHNWYDSISI